MSKVYVLVLKDSCDLDYYVENEIVLGIFTSPDLAINEECLKTHCVRAEEDN